MENKTISIFITLLFVATAFTNCKPEKKDDNTPVVALLLYANDQLSGSCAEITKNSSTSYTATVSSLPKGSCSQPATKEEAISKTQALLEKIVAIYTKAGSVCDSSSASISTFHNNRITTFRNMTTEQYNASIANKRVIAITNIVTETYNQLKNGNGYTDAQIAAIKPGSSEDYYALNAFEGSNLAACTTAIQNSGAYAGFFTTPPTVVAISSCTYGSSQPATTKCATLNTEF
ncbi:hypothetical protein EHQ68_00335 [Leptospira congkakensis]|uniref:Uncharacterized protein n=1 Tax=Leptospira congkakensis TaxID=2484932 RepID=A0A4Z1A952_9LEPT|nr:hypothetical protein [Leptospira congkakensis]TGL87845.1 hypothetical protein EHQ69_17270 [Leptospira congkakensis]TGL92622.1 hypothetical protein EHQ68_00335 [Leptospira congkakensis]TGL95996.1 hypothetical protein EHQ70_12940 [Leptospira congkakensis]